MSDHTTALVPITAGVYLSPGLRRSRKNIDIGLLCEALIYYDHVAVIVDDAPSFYEFVSWFVARGNWNTLRSLLTDNVLSFYHFKFRAVAAQKLGERDWSMWNVNYAPPSANTFMSQIVDKANLHKLLPHAGHRAQLYGHIFNSLVEVDAEEFGEAVENARSDIQDEARASLFVQALVDDLAPLLGWSSVPEITTRIDRHGERTTYTWNVDLENMSRGLGPDLVLKPEQILAAVAESNRIIWAAALESSDLYLGAPISRVVGDKLYEASLRLERPQEIVEDLKLQVDFPDVHQLVNQGNLTLDEVLGFRRRGGRFRTWLQDEGERDRDALIAYHHEVAEAAGWRHSASSVLRMFGAIGGAGLGATTGTPLGAMVGAAAGEGVKYLADVALRIKDADWRPVVFGDWVEERVKRILSRTSG